MARSLAGKKISNIRMEDAKIGFRNFAGRERLPYNQAGERNFAVFLEPAFAKRLEDDGWYIKWPKDANSDKSPFLSVKVSFDNVPPDIWKIVDGRKIKLDEDTVGSLDRDEILKVDLLIHPRIWFDDRTREDRVKAYLWEMFVTVGEGSFESKYANLPTAKIDSNDEEDV